MEGGQVSYTIKIGQAVLEKLGDTFDVTVRSVGLDDAPAFDGDDGSQKHNVRSPGYAQWDNFVRSVGLHAFFHDREHGLMREHPGTFRLRKKHLRRVEKALAEHKLKHPTAIPMIGGTLEDGALVRLEWLAWWFKWALENCSKPAMRNS